jgi:hypothetical protein
VEGPRLLPGTLRAGLEVRASDRGEEQGVADEERLPVRKVLVPLTVCPGVRRAPSLAAPDLAPVAERRERVGDGRALGHLELTPGQFGEHPGAGEVVGVDVGVEDVGDTTAALLRKLHEHLRVYGRVDHGGLLARADEIREAALAGVAHLDYLSLRARGRNLRGVPGC